MTEKALAFAKHYDIFCRAAGTMWTYTLQFDKKALNWNVDIPGVLEFFAPIAEDYKTAHSMTDEQLLDYINSKLVETCEKGDDLLILFEN